MDKLKEEAVKKRLEELRKKAEEASENEPVKDEIPNSEQVREAFRKNMGCGG